MRHDKHTNMRDGPHHVEVRQGADGRPVNRTGLHRLDPHVVGQQHAENSDSFPQEEEAMSHELETIPYCVNPGAKTEVLSGLQVKTAQTKQEQIRVTVGSFFFFLSQS